MARIGKLPVVAAANVPTPEDATYVNAYIDSVTGNLSVKKSTGVVTSVALA
jgi:hypothetical protein